MPMRRTRIPAHPIAIATLLLGFALAGATQAEEKPDAACSCACGERGSDAPAQGTFASEVSPYWVGVHYHAPGHRVYHARGRVDSPYVVGVPYPHSGHGFGHGILSSPHVIVDTR